ncbi:DUF6404 family protein [Actinomadura parmotrematis]|uniref:Sensor histidine kinase n=1 Tax=Actinomadura parmotrematis TaxID=2864039 RepID=A0ABS7FZF5_9ACTN|nr:DUF6404 family protein [Actinomadura parmotrematis]MBW8485833.1 hypothetical protein [Actinomadura parmotrematis]
MPTWRERLASPPAWQLFLGTGAPFGVLFGLFFGLREDTGPAVAVLAGLAAGVLFGATMTFLLLRSRRRDVAAAGTTRVTPIDLALRRGQAPADPADDDAALALIARRRRQLRTSYRYNPILAGALAVLGALQALLNPWWWLAAAFWAAMIPVSVLGIRRAQSRLDTAETTIRTRHP